MKPAVKIIFYLTLIVCSLSFIACDNPDGGEEGGMGNFTISFDDVQKTESSRVSVYPPSDSPQGNPDPNAPALSELIVKVTFTEMGSGKAKTFNFMGDKEIKGSIATGDYLVAVEVSLLDGSPYAVGGTVDGGNVRIQSGSNDPIRVKLIYKEPVVAVTLITLPSVPSYQGLPVNLTGTVLEFTYADGTTSLETDFSHPRFTVYTPGANSSGYSPIVEQGITPQTIFVTYMSINGTAFNASISIDVVDLVSVNATGKGAIRDQLQGHPYPNLDGIILEGYYSDGTIMAIPVLTDREDNWYETNEYYLQDDGVTTRTLIDQVSKIISYRVASNDADLPTFAQSIGDAPRTTTGTEIFVKIPFDNFIPIMAISAVSGLPTKTFSTSTNPMTINWADELEDLMIEIYHENTTTMANILVSFKYAAERNMVSVFGHYNWDLTHSNEPSEVTFEYNTIASFGGGAYIPKFTVPVNVVP